MVCWELRGGGNILSGFCVGAGIVGPGQLANRLFLFTDDVLLFLQFKYVLMLLMDIGYT